MDLRESLPPSSSTLRHPWEQERFRFFASVLHKHGLLGGGRQVLDVGAGDAWFAQQLQRRLGAGSIIDAVDTGYAAQLPIIQEVSGRTLRLHAEVPAKRYDLILLLDILEHIEDDRAMLDNLLNNDLLPGGHVLVSVPAWPSLYTGHDHWLGHFRRYRPTQARSLLEAAGLRVLQQGGLFSSLLLPRALHKAGQLLSGKTATQATDTVWNHGRLLTSTVNTALWLDNRLGVHVPGRPGLSWWALTRG